MTHDILVIRWDDVSGELVVFARQPFDKEPSHATSVGNTASIAEAHAFAQRAVHVLAQGGVDELEALRRRLAKAEEVVNIARVLDSYDWCDRLDDSKTSDDAKSDACELGIAVHLYDEAYPRPKGAGT